MDSAVLQKAASKLEGTTGYYDKVYIDAKSGKATSNGNNWIQVTTGTKLYIPMLGEGTLTLGTYATSESYFSTQTKTLTLTSGKTVFNISDDDIVTLNGIKYVLINVTKNGYINYIKTVSSSNTYSLTINDDAVNIINDLVANQVVKVLKELNVGYNISILKLALFLV